VTLTPFPDTTGTNWDPVVNLIAAPAANCGNGGTTGLVCLAGADDGAIGGPEVATYPNTTGATQNVFIVVDGYSGGNGPFNLTTTVGAPPPSDSCATAGAIPITDGGLYDAGTTLGYVNDISTAATTSCTNYDNTGADKVFSVTIPAGKTLTAKVNPESSFD